MQLQKEFNIIIDADKGTNETQHNLQMQGM